MGQALRRVVGSSRPSTAAPPRPASRQPTEVKPPPSRPGEAVERPGENLAEWNPEDPNFKTLVRQVAGSIVSRTRDSNDVGSGKLVEQDTRPLPKDRHTTILSGPNEDDIVRPGTLNVSHLRQLFVTYHGSEGKAVDVESIAGKFQVDPALLRRVLGHYSLHGAAVQVEDFEQKQEVSDRQVASGP
eukprot:TRINITY_DN7394_c0_g1_i1.p1 TRINITY_DN7394_c0_g1~~TRINITY_DN7394_c0_g1_i1.p1  ORF type:complete len:186 (+),score=30.46 TRINITY_DN7394_c0_g1_i1:81-638(+)